ncbi:MAG: glycosyltransferase family 4 protein [Prevotella sp.]|nr:glycosyltransferase family 4 protein [Prevotella sp.]
MMRAHILYINFLKPDGEGISIGGVQTYISNLIPVLKDAGYATVTIYQRATKKFHKVFDDYDVYGIVHPDTYGPKVSKALLDKALTQIDMDHDLLLYGCETVIYRKVPCRTIAIQHGISWDIAHDVCSQQRYIRHYIGKCWMAWKTIQRINKVDQLVCVDHNFVNWHRAISPYAKTKHIVIPNFSALPPQLFHKSNDDIQIVFARRFFPHRGTRLFADVAQRLIKTHPHINITIAGSGPDEAYMRKKLESFDNVKFTTYKSQDSLKIHADKDIAVIPTLGSEGTSLSLLEAMASGCAVVCTNVGGMTNIILDGYNGLIVNPDENALYDALHKLIEDTSLRNTLQSRAYDIVKNAFSLTIWQEKWSKVLKEGNHTNHTIPIL